MDKAISGPATAIMLVLVAVVGGAFVYVYTQATGSLVEKSDATQRLSGVALVEEVEVKGAYIQLHVRGLGSRATVDTVYVYTPKGELLGAITIPPKAVGKGQVATITLPTPALTPILNKTNEKQVILVVSGKTSQPTTSGTPVNTDTLYQASNQAKPYYTIGFIIDEAVNNAYPLNLHINYTKIHWFYFDASTGQYTFYESTSTTGNLNDLLNSPTLNFTSGFARVFSGDPSTYVLDLQGMTVNQRHSLGPVVIFVSPNQGTTPYDITVIPTYITKPSKQSNSARQSFVIHVRPIETNPNKVVFDSIILVEDLWKTYKYIPQWGILGWDEYIDNFIDHGLRFTVFSNNTVRFEVFAGSGGYLHAILYNASGLPTIKDALNNTVQYNNNGYLDTSKNILYVKKHGKYYFNNDTSVGTVYITNIENIFNISPQTKVFWDPQTGQNVTALPIVFTATIPG